MHVPTHILSGWCVANALNLTPRERLFAMFAAALPDIDGASYALGEETFQTYHHLLAHNLPFALVSAATLTFFSTHRIKAFVLFTALAHLHFAMDYFGSGPLWPIYYLWPIDPNVRIINKTSAWPLYSWQNTLAAGLLLAWTILIAARLGRTPIELIAPRLDDVFVKWLRRPVRGSTARREARTPR